MNGKLWLSAAFLFAVGMGANDLCGQNYSWFTDTDLAPFEDEPGSQGFNTGDTLSGVVRSNGQIMVSGSPVFYELVMSSAAGFIQGPDYDPIFHGPLPMFGVPQVEYPTALGNMRSCAAANGLYFAGGSEQRYRLRLDGSSAMWYRWPNGTPFDSTDMGWITIYENCAFFESPLEISGVLDGVLYLGSSHDIRIINDLRYACTNLNARNPMVPVSCNDYLVIASEGSVKIGNTIANGRANSAGLGREQTNVSFTDVRIHAQVFALNGSFTFEDQNDPDSGYVCQCAPDERGTIWLRGGINQCQRGFVHRSNNEGTGYVLKAYADPRWNYRGTNVWNHWLPYPRYPDSLNFGDVAVNTTAWDTLDITCECSMVCFGAFATGPFFASGAAGNNYGDSLRIPVSFTPSRVRDYSGTLTIYADFGTPVITLTGRGVNQLPATEQHATQVTALSLSVYPNPFNETAEIAIQLPNEIEGELRICDLLGREVSRWELHAGERSPTVRFGGQGLSTGIYLAVLEAGDERVVRKVMVMK